MSVRKTFAGVGVTSLVVATLAFTAAAPASALDPVANVQEGVSTAAAGDWVGTGSDTTQFVVGDVAHAFNNQATPPAHKIVTFAACVPPVAIDNCTTTPKDNITLPATDTSGTPSATSVPRPVNSGDGINLLHGSTNNSNVTFARASRPIKTGAELNDGLYNAPFAVDSLVMVTAKTTNAPANLTRKQILGIYTGAITDWSQVGGKPGPIDALQPQDGSGTLGFFQGQMAAEWTAEGKSGAPTYTSKNNVSGTPVHEHDPALIKNDPNAIAPFSLGRVALTGGVVSVVKGFQADRGVYNIFRGTQPTAGGGPVDSSWLAPTGSAVTTIASFFCSATARPLIEAEGFFQLKSLADGGICGVLAQNTADSANLSAYNAPTKTSTKVSVSGSTVTATVVGNLPTGSVNVNLGKAGNFPGTLTNGVASVTIPSTVAAGTYPVAVTYSGDASNESSGGDSTITVSGPVAKVPAITVPTKVIKVKAGKAVVKVTVSGITAPTALVIKSGSKVIAKVTVTKDGVVTIKIKAKKLKAGTKKYKVILTGAPAKTIKIKK